MIQLGARMQMLEAETRLSRERLLKLYKGSARCLATEGHAPVLDRLVHDLAAERAFVAVHVLYRFMCDTTGLSGLDAITKAYRLYLEHIAADDMEEVLSLTRAWTLVRFFDADLLQLATCSSCGGRFVAHA